MGTFFESLASDNILRLATHPLALTAVAVLFVFAILFRWKSILMLLFVVGAAIGIARYTHIGNSATPVSGDLAIFGIGSVAVALVVIYFLFVKGE